MRYSSFAHKFYSNLWTGNIATAIYEINQLNLYVGVCVKTKSDVTPFVILNIFISNCNLITHSFSVTVTDYNYFYVVIKLYNLVICN